MKQGSPNFDLVSVYLKQPIFMLTDPNRYLHVLFLVHLNFRVFPRFSVLLPLTPETTKRQKFQSFKSFLILLLFFFLHDKPHIATYITFYLYHNNTSLPTQYLHYLRLSELGKHYKTLNTLLTDKKILHH